MGVEIKSGGKSATSHRNRLSRESTKSFITNSKKLMGGDGERIGMEGMG